MQVSGREKKILSLAALVAVVFVITNGFPRVNAIYQTRQESIENLSIDMAREERLIENTASWRERRVEVEIKQAELETQLFSGDTVPIIAANIQRALSQYARDSGMTVSSTRLPEQLETADWLLVSQEMSFRTSDAGSSVSFLQKLENSVPRLWVTDFSFNQSRNQYSGSVIVAGFSRKQQSSNDAGTEQ